LASFKKRTLVRCEGAFQIKMQTAGSTLRTMLHTGGKRGTPWHIFVLKYPADNPWTSAADAPHAKKVHDTFRAELGDASYLMCFSGEKTHAYVAIHGHVALTGSQLARHSATEMHVITRLQGKVLFTLLDEMLKDAAMVFGNVEQKGFDDTTDVALTWQETREAIEGMTVGQVRDITADSKYASKFGKPTALQNSLLLFRDEVNLHYRDLQVCGALCLQIDSITTRYPTSFSPTVGDLQGWEFNHMTNELRHVTLDVYCKQMYMDKSLVMLGAAGAGKTMLCTTIARSFCVRKKKELIVSTKAYDPLGSLTRSGEIHKVGAFVFDDAPLMSLMNERLDMEHMKALLGVREVCSYPARYHTAVLPSRHARLFTANSGVHDGVVDHGAFFDRFHLTALANMARKNGAALRVMDEDGRAMCRRVVMFAPTEAEIGCTTVALQAENDALYAEELAVQEAYDAQ
jgi:hypothetical protein